MAFSQIADAYAGYHNASGLAATVALREQPLIPLMIVVWMVFALRSEVLAENLAAITGALTGVQAVHTQAQALAALPATEQQARLAPLPWSEQRKLTRLIETVGGQGDAPTSAAER